METLKKVLSKAVGKKDIYRLADVLRALGETKMMQRLDGFEHVSNLESLVGIWNLEKNILEDQSPECIEFLYNILNK